jgi:hypothetical protein
VPVEGIINSRRELFGWVQQVGLSALKELFELEVVQFAGPKGKHAAERSHYRWGSAAIALPATTGTKLGSTSAIVACFFLVSCLVFFIVN